MTVNLVLLLEFLLQYLGFTANKCASLAGLNLKRKEKSQAQFF